MHWDCKREQKRVWGKSGFYGNASAFTLLELMIVMAMICILATVAIPAYINTINRAKQADAVSALTLAQEQEASFWSDPSNSSPHYASTIGCLPSFAAAGANVACFAVTSCYSCNATTYTTPTGYLVTVVPVGTSHFKIKASKTISGGNDILTISDTNQYPQITPSTALKFSIFQWIFGE